MVAGKLKRLISVSALWCVVGTVVNPATGATPPPPCHALAVSPGFASDKTAFCYWFSHLPTPELRFFYTNDGLRSWRTMPATGIALTAGTSVDQLLVSPAFASDRTVFLVTSQGLSASTDYGRSFTLVSPLVTSVGRSNLTPFLDSSNAVAVVRPVSLLYADPVNDVPLLIRPPAHLPIPGSPDADKRFVLAPGYPRPGSAFVLAERRSIRDGVAYFRPVLHQCDSSFVCSQELWSFAEGQSLVDVYVAPDFPSSKRMFVVTKDSAHPSNHRLWMSADGGRSFRLDSATERLTKRARELGGSAVRIGLAFASPTEWLLSWGYSEGLSPNAQRASAIRANQLFRTRDSGRSWELVGQSAGSRQAGPKGTLPWTRRLASAGSYALITPTRNTVIVLGTTDPGSYLGAFCSTNFGRSWRTSC